MILVWFLRVGAFSPWPPTALTYIDVGKRPKISMFPHFFRSNASPPPVYPSGGGATLAIFAAESAVYKTPDDGKQMTLCRSTTSSTTCRTFSRAIWIRRFSDTQARRRKRPAFCPGRASRPRPPVSCTGGPPRAGRPSKARSAPEPPGPRRPPPTRRTRCRSPRGRRARRGRSAWAASAA